MTNPANTRLLEVATGRAEGQGRTDSGLGAKPCRVAAVLSLIGCACSSTVLAEGAGELGCARTYPTIYLVADQRPGHSVVDLFLSDACPGRVHLWTGVERLTADTIQQVGVVALASLIPVCVSLNTRCTGAWATDPDCVRIPPVAVTPIPSDTCPPRELPIAGSTSQSAGTVLRAPGTDADGNVLRCVRPAMLRDALGRRYLSGTRLAGCSASLVAPATRAEAPGSQTVRPTTTTFGGAALIFSDGFFDTKSFALPHVVTRMQGSTDSAGNVRGMGFALADLLRRWTFAYRVTIDLPAQLPRTER